MTPKPITKNTLFYGDNLPILREYIPDESVDLIYLDPPFNSNRSYNVLFKEESGKSSEAQLTAFDDTWHWGESAEETYCDLVENVSGNVGSMIAALRQFVGTNQMMAYLVMMAARLLELHRVLKPTGSLYLHCDPTASHYLKITLDTIYGPDNFRNEIIWKRQSAHSGAKRWGDVHDTLLFYSKTDNYTWNNTYQTYDERYLSDKYRYEDTGGKYMTDNLTGAGITKGDSGQPWREYDPTKLGRHWAVSREVIEALVGLEKSRQLTTQEKLDLLDANGYIYWPTKATGFPRFKHYLGKGVPIQGIINDIFPINSQAAERLGYPTQKPLELLERIIQASSNPGDIVLDPFCGCGTAIAAAEKLGRSWVGIDVTHLAISLIKYRMKAMFPACQFDLVGEPEDVSAARQLAQDNRYQFQWWALSLVRARPIGGEAGSKKGKKGSDQGIDGVINFIDDTSGTSKRVMVQVKSGHVKADDIRDLRGVLDREKAAIGIFITLERPTAPMLKEAVTSGYYSSTLWGKDYPKIQIFTVEELLSGQQVKMPPDYGTFKQAQKTKKSEGRQGELGI